MFTGVSVLTVLRSEFRARAVLIALVTACTLTLMAIDRERRAVAPNVGVPEIPATPTPFVPVLPNSLEPDGGMLAAILARERARGLMSLSLGSGAMLCLDQISKCSQVDSGALISRNGVRLEEYNRVMSAEGMGSALPEPVWDSRSTATGVQVIVGGTLSSGASRSQLGGPIVTGGATTIRIPGLGVMTIEGQTDSQQAKARDAITELR